MRLRIPVRGRSAALATVVALVATTVIAGPAAAATNPFDPRKVADSPVYDPPVPDREAISTLVVDPVPVTPFRPAAPNPHVVIISSGVDEAALPSDFAAQIKPANPTDTPDTVGYGTWAAATILQAAPGATVTSIKSFSNGRLVTAWVDDAFEWVEKYRADGTTPAIDAVLVAFPPHEYRDPLSNARDNAAEFDALLDTLSDRPLETADGSYVGSVVQPYHRDQQVGNSGDRERAALSRFHTEVNDWRATRAAIDRLATAGVPVVVPAGDLGAPLQKVSGLANLKEVVTVGAAVPATGGGFAVATTSASGPSLEGAVKPDLVAPVATVAIVPPASRLAGSLTELQPGNGTVWSADYEDSWANATKVPRARLASSMSAAALVATGLAGLRAEGVTDVAAMRGALAAAAEPVAGLPVWRQGAGILSRMPDRAFADGRTLVAGAANLGVTPAEGAWTASVAVRNGATGTPSVSLTDFAGVGRRGESVVETVNAAAAPVVTAAGGVILSIGATPGAEQAGLYCGYMGVPVPVVGDVSAREDVPICLVRAMAFYAESRYIHNAPAANVTYELLPGVPPAVEGPPHRAFEILPLDPTNLPLYVEKVQVGGCEQFFPTGYPSGLDPDKPAGHLETCAVFPAVPPGYYQTRLFSDYGSVVSDDGNVTKRDLGSKTAYQKLPMWVLPGALSPTRAADGAGVDYTEAKTTYRYDKTTNTWVVGENLDEAGLRFAYGHVKRIIGTAVTSRVIDRFGYDAFGADGFGAVPVSEATGIEAIKGSNVDHDLSAWQWRRGLTDATKQDLIATFNPLHSTAAVVPVGFAQYPLALTTPNYLLNATVDLKYEITDAVLLVVMETGGEFMVKRIDPDGTQPVDVPPGTPVKSFTVDTPWGTATGASSLKFAMKPKGSPEAMLWFVAVPTAVNAGGKSGYSGAKVSLSGLSVQYDTWTPATWPSKVACPGRWCDADTPEKLHEIEVDSNYNARQMDRACPSGATDCEDWSVFVHAPRNDARMHDVRSSTGVKLNDELRAAGAFRYRPDERTKPQFTIKPIMDVAGRTPGTAAFRDAFPFDGVTNNEFWDNVAVPKSFLAARPGALTYRFSDNVANDDAIAPLGSGPNAPVTKYVCYVPWSKTVGGTAPL